MVNILQRGIIMHKVNQRRFIKNVLILTAIVELANRSTKAIKPRQLGIPEGENFSKNLIQTLTYNEVNKSLTGGLNDK